jgi:hypothetical protein
VPSFSGSAAARSVVFFLQQPVEREQSGQIQKKASYVCTMKTASTYVSVRSRQSKLDGQAHLFVALQWTKQRLPYWGEQTDGRQRRAAIRASE